MPSSDRYKTANEFGLGDPHPQFKVYIANRPNFSDYSKLEQVSPLSVGEIHAIGENCGNGWRKVFNVYAKLVFALNSALNSSPFFASDSQNIVSLQGAQSWQSYRDRTLLHEFSNTSLLFSPPQVAQHFDEQVVKVKHNNIVHIIMGKTYAKSQQLASTLEWLDHEFAIDISNNMLVCPYFDYRQLSNIKIIRLVDLVIQFRQEEISP